MFNRRSTLVVLALLLAPFVLAGCSSNESGPVEAIDTAPPAAPVVTGIRAQGTSAVLHWAKNIETDVAGYNIYFFTPDPGSDQSYTKHNTGLITINSYTMSNLTVGTTYYFKITAVDWTGNESAASQPASVYMAAAEYDNHESRAGKFREVEE
ncbi:MAG: fibronectin type III domain-containing protein [Candidatus Eiseniibacteriota bacterium]|nr:MAG: fibronectin type III domain-containing protein [Candidatus Eisenbacteria bacterium]